MTTIRGGAEAVGSSAADSAQGLRITVTPDRVLHGFVANFCFRAEVTVTTKKFGHK